jgi:phage baseplate assembly protein gpV
MTLNSGETGAGITQGNSGIIISRGTSANAVWQYSEISSRFEGLIGANLSAIRAASPVNSDDVVTKGYLQSLPSSQPGGSSQSVQYSNGTSFLGDSTLRYNWVSGVFAVGNLQLTTNSIRNFNGPLQVNSPMLMPYATQPASVSSKVTLYANAPGSGGTGLYFVNTSTQDELISKSKATVLALIFS